MNGGDPDLDLKRKSAMNVTGLSFLPYEILKAKVENY